MKELSIEEKAKAYDGLIERLKDLKFAYRFSPLSDTIEEIFPELKKESDNERVRNKLIEFFKGYSPDEKWWGNITQEDILAWLEKQGEPKEINPSEFDSQLNRLLGQFKSLPKEELASSLSFYLNVVQNDGTYKEEKQGEQETLCDKCRKEHPSHSCQDITELGRCAVEHEQNHIDKVEPKFKVGDIIRLKDGDGLEWTVEKVFNNEYYTIVCADRDDFLLLDDNWELVEQKPWNEEDEERYESCLQKLGTGNPEQPETINSKWFKEHVYSQNTWRPSAKQIYSLDRVLCFYGKDTAVYDSVKELLEQLKKL